ncbi:MAG: GIY-YIG nuclease family protein [Candidatus Pacebacteria bacterium]|nr:GIY-YIG nuclease family protein [Candidatus Paceibacterota bacterium]
MIYLYVIRSLIKNYRHVGINNNLEKRLKEHDSGYSKATKPFLPFKIIRTEAYNTYTEARVGEKFLKSGVGRKFLNSLECND